LIAAFEATGTTGRAPLAVDFTDKSAGGPTTWEWDFQNDGVIDATGPNPSFVYEAGGLYSVRLRVSRGGQSDEAVVENMVLAVFAAPTTASATDTPTPTPPSTTVVPTPAPALETTPAPSAVALTISVAPEGGGAVDVLPPPGPDGKYRAGTNLVLMARPGEGFGFMSWAGGTGGTANPLSVTIDSDMSVVAVFTLLVVVAAPTESPASTPIPAPIERPAPAAAPAPAPPPAPAPTAAPVAPAAPAAVAAPAAGGCFIVGDRVTDCPPISPHTWQPPLEITGEY
jgi:PKD repeat protein